MTMTRPFDETDPYRRRPALARGFVPLALITLRVVFLLGNLVPDRARGGLVLVGVWLMFRDHMPVEARRPIATFGGLALLAYGLLAAAASVAAGGSVAQTGFAPSFGSSPFNDSITLDQAITPGQTFTVSNS